MVECEFDLIDTGIPLCDWEVFVSATECSDDVVLGRADRAFSFVGPMIVGGNVLALDSGSGEVRVKCIGSFIIEPDHVDAVSKIVEEGDGTLVG